MQGTQDPRLIRRGPARLRSALWYTSSTDSSHPIDRSLALCPPSATKSVQLPSSFRRNTSMRRWCWDTITYSRREGMRR